MNTKASCGDNSQDNFTSTVEQVFLNQLYIKKNRIIKCAITQTHTNNNDNSKLL